MTTMVKSTISFLRVSLLNKPREYKARVKKYVILRFPNTSKGLKDLNDTKLKMKHTYYKDGKTHFRVYGRCKDIRSAYKKSGLRYSEWTAMSNDISLRSPAAKYCYEWVLYVKPVMKHRA
jgi:hypothetical protein